MNGVWTTRRHDYRLGNIAGFSLGAESIALFAEWWWNLYKAADVGADLVGKVEAGIPGCNPLQLLIT
jgi:Na+/H+-translocating membrane pyrophosphatase